MGETARCAFIAVLSSGINCRTSRYFVGVKAHQTLWPSPMVARRQKRPMRATMQVRLKLRKIKFARPPPA